MQNMMDDDEFDALSVLSFTTEDLEQIDLLSQATLHQNESHSHNSSNGPLLSVEVEPNKTSDDFQKPNKSPYSQYRTRQGHLSVSDVVAPAWCEVQFDYGLQQRRQLPVAQRPAAFVTPAGNEIKVEQKIVVRKDKVLKAGTVVHKKLEKEVHKETVPVTTQTREDNWALRLLDFLTRLQSLKNDGFCRELQVAGVVEEQMITGIIDEIRIARPSLSELLSSGLERATHSPKKGKQKALENFFPRLHRNGRNSPNITLQIVDNKTRSNAVLPPHADTLPSRLQLMLYFRIISDMLTRGTPHFHNTWKHKKLDPSKPFSEKFKDELNIITIENDLSFMFLDANCLEDIVLPFHDTIDSMGINREISKSLFLVYRRRAATEGSRTKRKKNLRDMRSSGGKKKRVGSRTPDSSTAITEGDAAGVKVEETAILAQGDTHEPASDKISSLALVLYENKPLVPTNAPPVDTAGTEVEETAIPAKGDRHEPASDMIPSFAQVLDEIKTVIAANAPSEDPAGMKIEETATPAKGDTHEPTSDTIPSFAQFLDEIKTVIAPPKRKVPKTHSAVVTALRLLSDAKSRDGKGRRRPSASKLAGTSKTPIVVEDSGSESELEPEDRAPPSPTIPSNIIGTKKFQYNKTLLDTHITSILEWWHGKRPAKGVEIEQTYRCNSCEYKQDCEWRAMKAEEIVQKSAMRRSESSKSTDTRALEIGPDDIASYKDEQGASTST